MCAFIWELIKDKRLYHHYRKILNDYKTYLSLKVFIYYIVFNKVFFYIPYMLFMKNITKKTPVVKKSLAKKPLAKRVLVKKTVAAPQKKFSWLWALAIGNVVGFIVVLMVNYLAVSIPLGGMTTGQLSDLYPNLFVPAALTFSIWGIIYLLLLGFIVWQLVDFYKKQSIGITKKIWIWFLLSCVANIWRMFAWQYQYVLLSVFIIIFFLITLIVVGNRIQLGKKLGSLGDKYLVQVPFSIYLWRLSVATIANITAVLVHFKWNMFGQTPVFWTILVMIVATLLWLLSLKKTYNIMYALVIIRAFIGIIIKRLWVTSDFPIVYTSIIRTAGICITVLAAGIWAKFKQRKNN